MTMRTRTQKGFTILEAMIALSLGSAFMATVFQMWGSSTQLFKQQSLESKLHLSVETALERLKDDIRLADGNQILYYPANGSEYTAVSIPTRSVDANGFYAFQSGGGIQWDGTVLYHVFEQNGKKEFRRTVIPSFDSNSVNR